MVEVQIEEKMSGEHKKTTRKKESNELKDAAEDFCLDDWIVPLTIMEAIMG